MQLVVSHNGITAQTTDKASIEILNPPERLSQGHVLLILYRCEDLQVVHVELLASSLTKTAVGVFKKRWTCSPGESGVKEVRLDLPDQIVYREDYFIRYPVYIRDAFLRGWISEYSSDINIPDTSAYSSGVVRTFHFIKALPPYSRPYKQHHKTIRWDQNLIWQIRKDKIPQCEVEQEAVHLLTFPYASTGERFGVLRVLEPYGDRVLESRRQELSSSPRCLFRFSLSAWVFLVQWCSVTFCGLLYHLDQNNEYITPTILLTNTGRFHVQVELVSGEPQAFQTASPVPLYEWCHIQLTFDISLVRITYTFYSFTHMFKENILLSDTVGSFILGGSQYVPGVNGFYGPVLYHRNRIQLINYQSQSPQHITSLEMSQWYRKCQMFKEECLAQFQQYLVKSESRTNTEICSDVYYDLVSRYRTISSRPQCTQWEGPPRPHRALVTWLLKRAGQRAGHYQINTVLLGRTLYRKYLKRVHAPEGLSRMRGSISLLLQAGCLGYSPALYLASVFYQTGFGIKKDHNKALRFKLISAQDDERLSLLSLGHKHHLGVDDYPVDYDLSYAYYSNVAHQTMEDRLQPNKDQAYVEYIRLIDEDVLKLQTKEDDDLFMWLRFQAKQGVTSAQQSVSRMLFWGQQGISSNMQAAVRLYEKGAVQQKDPVMMYDYGVVLLRGQGVKQDIPKALEYLKKSADMNFVPAINSLGWYYEQYEKDYKKAIEFWEKADRLGNPEAPFNLGIMHYYGLYPGKQKNLTAAYLHYARSANRGHIDAAVYMSDFWIQGIPGFVDRQPRDAVIWTKWAAEQNGYLGAALRKALDGYLELSWPQALLHYMQVAEAGFEIGQFNTAYICEQDPDGLVSKNLQIDCVWKYYNLSTHGDPPHAYAQIKMGDLYYAQHVKRRRDVAAAVRMYKQAALQREPQGLYSLGILIEEGVNIPVSTLRELGLNSTHLSNNYTIIMELYRRCRDHEKEDSYVPCSLALLNAHLQYVWAFHSSIVKCSSAIAIAIVTALSLMTILGRLTNGALNLHQSV
ncbi:protein sel-1 homolog 3 [Bombina bombina]|uniref:protein sel-1 homolog 3 n=1 Tax=Bombina bombina TaxID=8345 RepID=UPI00235B193C|nr:protein sel-1 homolog 3 [Bombina bombina]